MLSIVSTFWFLIGDVIDVRRLFIDFGTHVDNPLDNGMVEGSVSLVDREAIEQKDRANGNSK